MTLNEAPRAYACLELQTLPFTEVLMQAIRPSTYTTLAFFVEVTILHVTHARNIRDYSNSAIVRRVLFRFPKNRPLPQASSDAIKVGHFFASLTR